ncbi:MAG: beta-barrel assembly-enhancing protease [Desulfobulbaceae bacterium]
MKFNHVPSFRPLLHAVCALLLVVTQMLPPMPAHALTIGEERDIGEKLLYKIRTELHLLDDPDIVQYINRLGRMVVDQAGPQFFDYRFYLVPSDEFNAFAAPSGLIFFYTGLVKTMKTEDELLSVMAHEIGHVVSRHISSRSDKAGKVGAISMALALASLAIGDPSLASGLFTGFQAAGQAVTLHFSRQDEEEADRLSYDWLKALHRDPQAMEGMLGTMRRITRYRSDQIPPYLLTHPNPEARLDYVQSLLDYQQDKVQAGTYRETDNFEFLRLKYRAMVLVDDPQKTRAFFANAAATGSSPEEIAMATYGLALLEAKELNFSKALDNLDKVRAYFVDRPMLDVDEGIIHLDSGNAEKAIELLGKALSSNPEDMYAAFHLARANEMTGKVNEAERLYTKVMSVLPEYPRVYFEMGRIRASQGRKGMSNFYLAKYYLYQGRMELAKEYFKITMDDSTVDSSVQEEADSILTRLDELEEM